MRTQIYLHALFALLFALRAEPIPQRVQSSLFKPAGCRLFSGWSYNEMTAKIKSIDRGRTID